MITGLAHVNLIVPAGSLDDAQAFYANTLGLVSAPVPEKQRGTLLWFNIGDSGQQVHVAFGRPVDFEATAIKASRHPCFRLGSLETLLSLQERIWEHYQAGGKGAPSECDKPGGRISGPTTIEYPDRFFARDFAGNRLEFSL